MSLFQVLMIAGFIPALVTCLLSFTIGSMKEH